MVDHFAQCEGEDAPPAGLSRSKEARAAADRSAFVEREANHFTTEMLMHEPWAAPLCKALRPSLDDVDRLATTFRMSLHASALRYVELSSAPCAFVHTVNGRIKRSTETEAFPGRIVMRREVHPESLAAKLRWARAGSDGEPREVSGAAWGWDDAPGAAFVEHAIALGPELGVMSWIVPV